MTDNLSTDDPTQPSSWATRIEPTRKAPKTVEQLLAEAEKRTGMLRTKVIANRDRQRLDLVDELYVKYDVAATADDVSESKRMLALRGKLNL